MQMDDAAELRRKWKAKGDPPCDHPHLDKEYYLGTQTMDYVCTRCGVSNSKEYFEKLKAERKRPK